MTDYRPRGLQVLPPVVKNIIIINVIMVVLQFVLGKQGINLGDYLGLHYWRSPMFRWWQPITHLFMHGDPYDVQLTILHIFSNMFALWMFGSVLENLWGPKRFFIFYMVCGLGAAFCHLGVLTFQFENFHNAFMQYQEHPGYDAFVRFAIDHHISVNPDVMAEWARQKTSPQFIQSSIDALQQNYSTMINENTVGASGAVFGVLFAFGYLFPNTPLYLFFIPIPIPAKYFVFFYAVFELSAGLKNTAGDNVAHFAHLGGLLFAFILLRIWKTNRKRFY